MTHEKDTTRTNLSNPLNAIPDTDPPYPSLEGLSLERFLKLPDDYDADARDKLLKARQFEAVFEASQDNHDVTVRLAEQSVLLDAAFRYYLSGGEELSSYAANFVLALRAQAQSAKTVRALRIMRRNADIDRRDRDRYLDKLHDKVRERKDRENSRNAERSHRYSEHVFSRPD